MSCGYSTYRGGGPGGAGKACYTIFARETLAQSNCGNKSYTMKFEVQNRYVCHSGSGGPGVMPLGKASDFRISEMY